MSEDTSQVQLQVVVGSQWGDEGKGKLVDILCEGAKICGRCQGGNNAGHTVKVGEHTYDFHLLPSGIVQPGCTAVIGNGVVVHIPSLFKEIEHNRECGPGLEDWRERLIISSRAHIVLDLHQSIDGWQELGRSTSLGTTRRGIGPVYSSKTGRQGLRFAELVYDFDTFATRLTAFIEDVRQRWGDLVTIDTKEEIERYRAYAEQVRPLVRDTVGYMNKAWRNKEKIIVEGANAIMLDIDFGTYPFVTSSNSSVGGVCTGLGLPPSVVQNVYGVVKAYTTRVGEGAFPTEDTGAVGDKLQTIGQEWGVTTKRKRRCGWLDLQVVRYAHMLANYTGLCITKLDVLDTFETIEIGVDYSIDGVKYDGFPADMLTLSKVKVNYITVPGWQQDITQIRKYADLPLNARLYVEKIEELTGVPVKWVGVGPGRDALITKE